METRRAFLNGGERRKGIFNSRDALSLDSFIDRAQSVSQQDAADNILCRELPCVYR